MDHSESSQPRRRASRGDKTYAPTREQRLLRRRRITAFLGGLKFGGIAFLFGACTFPLGAYPLGIALLCAATHHAPYVFVGVVMSGLLSVSPLPFWGHLLLCTVILGFRLLFLWGADRPSQARRGYASPKRSSSAHAFISSLQEILWGVPAEDTMTDYYCGKNNTPAPPMIRSAQPPVSDVQKPQPIPIPPFGERMIYRLLGCEPADALNGTTALNVMALERGASILRVHDVKECVEAVRLYEKMNAFEKGKQ